MSKHLHTTANTSRRGFQSTKPDLVDCYRNFQDNLENLRSELKHYPALSNSVPLIKALARLLRVARYPIPSDSEIVAIRLDELSQILYALKSDLISERTQLQLFNRCLSEHINDGQRSERLALLKTGLSRNQKHNSSTSEGEPSCETS